MSDQAFLDEFIIQRGAIESLARMEKEIGNVLGDNGCDCECGHGWEDHEEDCERCLACRVSEPLMGVGRIIMRLSDAANHGKPIPPNMSARLHDWLEANPYRKASITRNPPNQRGWRIGLSNNYFSAAHRSTGVTVDGTFDEAVTEALDQWDRDCVATPQQEGVSDGQEA